MSDDGGMQWYAEVGMREEEEQRIAENNRLSALLEAHRKWVKEFNEKADKEKAHEVDG